MNCTNECQIDLAMAPDEFIIFEVYSIRTNYIQSRPDIRIIDKRMFRKSEWVLGDGRSTTQNTLLREINYPHLAETTNLGPTHG
jgi:hypothetical protein